MSCDFYKRVLIEASDWVSQWVSNSSVTVNASCLIANLRPMKDSCVNGIIPPSDLFFIESSFPHDELKGFKIGIMSWVEESDGIRTISSLQIKSNMKLSSIPSEKNEEFFAQNCFRLTTDLQGNLTGKSLDSDGHPMVNCSSYVNGQSTSACIVCEVCSFMSAKNISTVETRLDLSPREKRHLNRKKTNPNIKYHELVVRKIGKKYESISSEKDGSMPLHLCRGHLRTYTPERPLFGLYSGTYFVHAHFRGKKENGEVEKTYLLKT
ncbi:MAG: hypothetical protein DRP56_08795 [Planctomycetota bacterium]|nr:MAG: hypothetical protein DRP56_08795 [Planctomycetota bacterium]